VERISITLPESFLFHFTSSPVYEVKRISQARCWPLGSTGCPPSLLQHLWSSRTCCLVVHYGCKYNSCNSKVWRFSPIWWCWQYLSECDVYITLSHLLIWLRVQSVLCFRVTMFFVWKHMYFPWNFSCYKTSSLDLLNLQERSYSQILFQLHDLCSRAKCVEI
jgi:hypothetical protein